jgi:tetratricopeptide (TPR) repeat protein
VLAYEGDFPKARSRCEEAVAILRQVSNSRDIATVLLSLGEVTTYQGDQAAARSSMEEAMALARDIGHQWLLARAHLGLGLLSRSVGDYPGAKIHAEEALGPSSDGEHRRGIAFSRFLLGEAARSEQDYALARGHYTEALKHFHTMGCKKDIVQTLFSFACLEVAEERMSKGARLLGTSEALREATGFVWLDEERRQLEQHTEMALAALGDDRYRAACAAGRAMSMDEAVRYALVEDGAQQA